MTSTLKAARITADLGLSKMSISPSDPKVYSVDTFGRRNKILDMLQSAEYLPLGTLIDELGVAPATVHRDLEYLAGTGAIERVRGGARRPPSTDHSIRTDFTLRLQQSAEAKKEIAQRATSEIEDGATVFLDSSTTALAVARELEKEQRRLTIVTNSPAIAYESISALLHIIMAPGDLNPSLKAVTGPWTVEFLSKLSFSMAVVSAAGITPSAGLVTTQRDLADVATTAVERASRSIAVIDASKFGTTALIQMVPPGRIEKVITDSRLDPQTAAAYRASGWAIEIGP
ncbi:DeoR/GlpR family DNA-binding transcription regulator [Arthrobacter sp. NPDC080031]|uniref:DeoR/GlpR family DNA-binding transcription regulator n=1 Tax=Arthrobacter sp. NPDC080031 TaxID=3155918 RepID=UPI00344CA00E